MQETTQNGKDTWKSSIEMARDHFNKGLKELGKAGQQAKLQGKDAWRSAQERMREAFDDVKVKGAATWEETRERSEEFMETSREYVSGNPLKAVGYSALAGLVLGLLLFSNRKSVKSAD